MAVKRMSPVAAATILLLAGFGVRGDDGKTDPVSLAYGIAPQCAPQYQQFTEAEVGSYITENAQKAQRQLWKEKELQMITSAVIIHRSKQKPS